VPVSKGAFPLVAGADASKTHPHTPARLAPSRRRVRPVCRKRRTLTLPDWRLRESRVHAQRPRPCGRRLRLTSIRVGTRLCPEGTAGRSTTIGIRLAAIRRSLVPGRPFCPAAAVRPTRLRIDRPDRSSTRRCRRFPWFPFRSSLGRVLDLSARGSGVGSAGVHPTRNTRPTAHQRCAAPGTNPLRRHFS
jgi:hypothetical protein